MHSVTKVLVALAAVLSVFLSAMVIAYAANTDRIRTDFEGERALRLTAEASLAGGNAGWAAAKEEKDRQIAQLNALLLEKDKNLAVLELERATLSNERAEARRAADSFKSRVDDFGESIKTMQALLDRYSKEVSELRKNELAYRQQRLEIDERLSNQQSQIEVLSANNQALKEQIFEAQQRLAGGGTGSANIGLSAPLGGVEATQRIVGRIENVTRDGATGRTLVKLGVGTNNGVAANMLFRVVRGNEWVANVVIVQADLGFSIGEVNITSKSGAVQVGDEARTKLQ